MRRRGEVTPKKTCLAVAGSGLAVPGLAVPGSAGCTDDILGGWIFIEPCELDQQKAQDTLPVG